MKKYEIIKNGKDDYTLKYKDQEINFKSTINIVNELQKVNKKARLNLILDLEEQGKTLKDLVKEEKRDGKTYFDNTNRLELEKIYIEDEQSKVFQDMITKMLGKDLFTLISEMELTTEEEISGFSEELGKVMAGQTPSGKSK